MKNAIFYKYKKWWKNNKLIPGLSEENKKDIKNNCTELFDEFNKSRSINDGEDPTVRLCCIMIQQFLIEKYSALKEINEEMYKETNFLIIRT